MLNWAFIREQYDKIILFSASFSRGKMGDPVFTCMILNDLNKPVSLSLSPVLALVFFSSVSMH